jgi:hypothetical protein
LVEVGFDVFEPTSHRALVLGRNARESMLRKGRKRDLGV